MYHVVEPQYIDYVRTLLMNSPHAADFTDFSSTGAGYGRVMLRWRDIAE